MKLILMLISIYLLCIEYNIKFGHATPVKPNQCKWIISTGDDGGGGGTDDGDGDETSKNINLLSCELHTFNETFNIINYFYSKSKTKFTVSDYYLYTNILKLKCINSNNLNNNNVNPSAFNLNHIKQFNNLLQELYIENCRLNLIGENEFSQFQKLFKLSLNNYHHLNFHQKSFTGLQNIFELDLSNNHLKMLPEMLFYNLDTLKILNLSMNHLDNLTNLSMDFKNNVEVLDVSHNKLTKLAINDLSTFKRLSVLHLNNNKLHKLDEFVLMGLKHLQIINLANNRVDRLMANFFKDNINLLKINMRNNHLKYLDETVFDSLVNLERLDLSQNNLTSLVVKNFLFARLTKLVSLNIGHNHLTTIDGHILKSLISLESLCLESNSIRNLNANIFANLSNLVDLNMNGNKMDRIPRGLSSLVSLQSMDLGKNHIKSIDRHDFHGLVNLNGLRLIDNQIENITSESLRSMPSLHILNVASNRISHIERNAFTNNALHFIRLDNNRITDISSIFSSLQQLLWLNISDNQIENFDFKYLPTTLQWLDIHKNNIRQLKNSFKQNPQQQQYFYDDTPQSEQLNLKYMDASYNKIEVLNENSVPLDIEEYNLNNNNISKIATGTFLNKNYLKKVHLQHNLLESFEKNVLLLYTNKNFYLNNEDNAEFYSSGGNSNNNKNDYNSDLPEFYLQNNPLKCDCQMDWLKTLNTKSNNVQMKYPKIVDYNELKCYKAMNHLPSGKNQNLVPQYKLNEIEKDEFLCKYENTYCMTLCTCCDYENCDCKMTCPSSCSCYYDYLWQSNVVDCGFRNFTMMPKHIPMSATKIYLDGNSLTRFHEGAYFVGKGKLIELYLNNSNIEVLKNNSFNDLQQLKILHLEYNRLKMIAGNEFSQLFQLEKLYLNNNQLGKIAIETFQHMKHLKVLNVAYNNLRTINFLFESPIHQTIVIERDHFVGNLWYCNCKFLHEYKNYEATINRICHADNFRNCKNGLGGSIVVGVGGMDGNEAGDKGEINEIINFMDKREFIKEIINTRYMQLIGAVLVALIGTAVIITLVFIFRNKFTLWAYTKYGIRLKKVPAADAAFDDSKIYDCFLFYSYQDYDLVHRVVNFQLEKYGYCTCLQHRYGNQIFSPNLFNESVELSKKLLLVVTPNFLQYEWSNMNFRLALKTLIFKINKSQRQYKIILIVAVPVDLLLLDPILDILIKTSTALFWGEKNFWNKLKYAMPDINKKSSNNTKSNTLKSTLNHRPYNDVNCMTVQHHYVPASHGNISIGQPNDDDYENDEDYVNNFGNEEEEENDQGVVGMGSGVNIGCGEQPNRTINILTKDDSTKKHSFSRELPNNRTLNFNGNTTGGNGSIKLSGNGTGTNNTKNNNINTNNNNVKNTTTKIIDIETAGMNGNDSNDSKATGHIYNTISEIQAGGNTNNNNTTTNTSIHPQQLPPQQKAYFV